MILEKLVCKVDAANDGGKSKWNGKDRFITDDENIIAGLITDEYRAHLLEEKNFNVSVSEIMKRDFVYLHIMIIL